MFYDAYHRIENISNPNGAERIYTVVGNICETDTFAWDRKINEVREGDLLVFIMQVLMVLKCRATLIVDYGRQKFW